jgi:hypothetical protein
MAANPPPPPDRRLRRPPPLPPGDRPRPAGHVLVSMLVAFALATLLSADRLEQRVEAKPEGLPRSVSVALVRGVGGVAGLVGLDRPGAWIEQVVGDAREPAGTPPGASGPVAALPETRSVRSRPGLPGTDRSAPGLAPRPATTTTVRATAPLRRPSPKDPLRVWVGGDSLAQTFGESLLRMGQERGELAGVTDARVSSGLLRPGYFDWPAQLATEVLPEGYEVLVFMVGANDTDPLATGGRLFDMGTPEWEAEYRRRVAAVMDLVGDAGRVLVWVGQPPLRSEWESAELAVLDRVYAEEAGRRPWVSFFDTSASLAGPGGGYAAYVEVEGRPVRVREGDGVHLTRAGADLAAGHVLEAIARFWR